MASTTRTSNPLPALAAEERSALRASIEREGVLIPIVISAGPAMQGQIVDGFNRHKIWVEELGRKAADLPSVSKRFATEAEFRIAQIDANLARRQLTLVQRVNLAIAREPWEKRLAADRMRAGKASGKSAPGSPVGARAAEIAANAVGLKRSTYEHARFVLEKAPKLIRTQFEAGTLSVDRAYKETRRELGLDARTVVAASVAKRFGRVPTGSYGAIVLTPPWRAAAKGYEAGRVVPAELGAIDLRSLLAKDAVLVIVAPGRWLREALDLVTGAWGAAIVAVVAKLRTGAADGSVLRERAEFAIIATLGRPTLPATSRDNVVETDAQLFALVDALVPDRPGIVLFGETARAGWSGWNPTIA